MSFGTKLYIVMLIVGIVMIITSVGDSIRLFKDGSDLLSSRKLGEIEQGEMMTGNMEYVFDTIATLESSNTIYGIPVSKKTTPYYLVYVDRKDEGFYILVHATTDESIKTMDNIMHDTQNLLMDETGYYVMNTKGLSMDTKAIHTPDKVKEYLYEYFADADYSRSDVDALIDAEITLEQIDYDRTKVLPFIGVGVVVLPTIIFLASRNKAKKYKSSRTTYVNEGPSTEALMNEYNNAPQGYGGRRYNPESYNTGGSSYEPGAMDELNPDEILGKKE